MAVCFLIARPAPGLRARGDRTLGWLCLMLLARAGFAPLEISGCIGRPGRFVCGKLRDALIRAPRWRATTALPGSRPAGTPGIRPSRFLSAGRSRDCDR